MNPNFNEYLLKVTHSSSCKEIEVIQSLWSGYGKISRFQLMDSFYNTVVVKCISPNPTELHPRGWNTDNSHQRKVKSYQVETNWYNQWNQFCTADCRTPKLIGSFSEGNNQWIILEDLDTQFPLRKEQLNLQEVKVCLSWLANFHATFLQQKPIDLWKVGTYWHLETRSDEWQKIEHTELKYKAHLIDKKLNQCTFKTLVHGDAKLANFCFSDDGKQVAAVDFQYVGGGCGMKDVVYFLGSCLSGKENELYEKGLLDVYFGKLNSALQSSSNKNKVNFAELEQEWRQLYPFASADFSRFLLGWMPSHQKLTAYSLNIVDKVLSSL